jgi:16S rRNA (cytidine1402-2'-O)-methyltransferase
MYDILGNRKVAICRELTKKFEEFIRGNLSEVVEWAHQDEIRGEFCLIIEGADESKLKEEESSWWETLSIEAHVNHYIAEQDIPSKEAIKQTAKDRGINKREVYQAYHIDQ